MVREKIDSLKKVKLSIQAGTEKNHWDLTPQPVEWELITGVGAEGLTPFEFMLTNRYEGGEVEFELKPGEFEAIFGHLFQSLYAILPELYETASTRYVKLKILQVAPAENREIVKALAQSTSCEGCCGTH